MKQVTLSERAVEKIEELQDPDLYFGCKATIADAFAVLQKSFDLNKEDKGLVLMVLAQYNELVNAINEHPQQMQG